MVWSGDGDTLHTANNTQTGTDMRLAMYVDTEWRRRDSRSVATNAQRAHHLSLPLCIRHYPWLLSGGSRRHDKDEHVHTRIGLLVRQNIVLRADE